jgi:hypothetical protein
MNKMSGQIWGKKVKQIIIWNGGSNKDSKSVPQGSPKVISKKKSVPQG